MKKNQRTLLILLLLLLLLWRWRNRNITKKVNGGGNGNGNGNGNYTDQSFWNCVGGVAGNLCVEVNSVDANADSFESLIECQDSCMGSPANPSGNGGTPTNGGGNQPPCINDSGLPCIWGCMDPTAMNYYAGADMDDGSCCYSFTDCCDKGVFPPTSTACSD
tara:strand:+ start:382 stop:867 length:486 start_codon:yes stop_codon:yes gene_type:complete